MIWVFERSPCIFLVCVYVRVTIETIVLFSFVCRVWFEMMNGNSSQDQFICLTEQKCLYWDLCMMGSMIVVLILMALRAHSIFTLTPVNCFMQNHFLLSLSLSLLFSLRLTLRRAKFNFVFFFLLNTNLPLHSDHSERPFIGVSDASA